MRKFLIITALVVSMLIFAAGYRNFATLPQTSDRPYLLRNLANESDVTLKVKVEKIDYFYRREVAIVETDEGTAMVVVPYKLSRYYGINLESGLEITVEGKKITINNEILIIPSKIIIGDKSYDMTPIYRMNRAYLGNPRVDQRGRFYGNPQMYMRNPRFNHGRRGTKGRAKPFMGR